MISRYDKAPEYPARMYRAPEQICSDIRRVAARIREINDMLNIRNIIAEVISEHSEGDPLRRIEAVDELLDYANEALCEMRSLDEALTGLKQELFEAQLSAGYSLKQ